MPIKTSYEHGRFCWAELLTHDMDAALGFYGELFGWTNKVLADGEGRYSQFEQDGKGVSGIGQLCDEMKAQGIPSLWNCYINVDDVAAMAKKAEDLGANVTVPPMQVMEAGWLAFIQDPTGANVGLWQRNRHVGAELIGDPVAMCWTELMTKDVDKAKDFYSRLLGWEYEDCPDSPTAYYIIKNQGEHNGGIMQMTEECGEMPPYWGVYFHVKDVPHCVERLEKLGGKVLAPPFDTAVGPIAVVADPQGACFSVIALKMPPVG